MIISSSEHFLRSRKVPLGVLLLLGFATLAYACQVPLFRYALERWTPDRHELVLTPGEGALAEKEQSAIDLLGSLPLPSQGVASASEHATLPSGGVEASIAVLAASSRPSRAILPLAISLGAIAVPLGLGSAVVLKKKQK